MLKTLITFILIYLAFRYITRLFFGRPGGRPAGRPGAMPGEGTGFGAQGGADRGSAHQGYKDRGRGTGVSEGADKDLGPTDLAESEETVECATCGSFTTAISSLKVQRGGQIDYYCSPECKEKASGG